MKSLAILATNDLHGQLTPSKLPFLLAERAKADLYFDSGDAIKAGNLSLPLKQEPVWDYLAQARCTASCPGNRESHVLESGFKAKTRGMAHPVVCCNWTDKAGSLLFPATLQVSVGEVKVGVVGVMVPMVTERMKTAPLSQYLWLDPVASLTPYVASLRAECDVVVVLSHLGYRQDLKLAVAVEGIDLILGGHSHTVLSAPERVEETWICQGGSHAKYMGVYQYAPESKQLTGGLVAW